MKKVAVRHAFASEQVVVSAHGHDAFILTVSQEQLLAKGEESRVGQAIVLQNDCLLHLFKGPLHSGHYAPPASQILVRIILKNLTVPVYPVNEGPRRRAFLRLARNGAPWAIGNNQQLARLCSSDSSEDPFGYFRTIEDNENSGSAHPSDDNSQQPIYEYDFASAIYDLSGFRFKYPPFTLTNHSRLQRLGLYSKDCGRTEIIAIGSKML